MADKKLTFIVGADVSGFKKSMNDANNEIKKANRDWKKSFGAISEEITKMGKSMMVVGGAITAAFGLTIKAAEEERVNIAALSNHLKNVGVAYDDVKDSIEGVITATQRKTGIADNEQRDILGRLLLVTHDYQSALDLLPTTLDLAAAGQMDATTAATYLGKAMKELQNGAESVTVRLGQASVKFSSLQEIMDYVGGAAEATASPFAILKAELGDLAEQIGAILLPVIKNLIDSIMPVLIKIKTWIEENPKLAETIVKIVAAVGLLTLTLGTVLVIIPKLITGVRAFGIAMKSSMGIIGLVIMAIELLVMAGIAIKENWGAISNFFKKVWSDIKITFLIGINGILELLKAFLGWLPGIGDKLQAAQDKISGIINAEKIKESERKAEYELNKVTKAAEKAGDKAVEIVEEAQDKIEERLKETGDAAKDLHDANIKRYQDEYDEKIRLLDAETDATIKGINDQIDALDAQQEADDRAKEDAERLSKRSELIQEIANTGGNQSAWDALFAYDKETADIEAKRAREDQKTKLQASIDDIKAAAETTKATYLTERDAKITAENDILAAVQLRLQAEKEAGELSLQESLQRIEQNKQAHIAAAQAMYAATKAALEAGATTPAEAAAATVSQVLIGTPNNSGTSTGVNPFDAWIKTGGVNYTVPKMALGGIVTKPTIAMIGEAGAEAVVPLSGSGISGNITVNLYTDAVMGNEADARRFARKIGDIIRENNRLQTYGRSA